MLLLSIEPSRSVNDHTAFAPRKQRKTQHRYKTWCLCVQGEHTGTVEAARTVNVTPTNSSWPASRKHIYLFLPYIFFRSIGLLSAVCLACRISHPFLHYTIMQDDTRTNKTRRKHCLIYYPSSSARILTRTGTKKTDCRTQAQHIMVYYEWGLLFA